MNVDQVYNKLLIPNDSKLALVVLDGLGDIATQSTGFRTPLEAARTPNFDMLAKRSALGRMTPVAPGITPGSGPGHLGLFGYDPLEYEVGRGVIEAIGLGIDLKLGDIAARANFCSLDAKGIVTDRRAGRIDTKVCEAQCALLAGKIKKIGDVEVIIKAGKGHRFVVVFRGKGLEVRSMIATRIAKACPSPSSSRWTNPRKRQRQRGLSQPSTGRRCRC